MYKRAAEGEPVDTGMGCGQRLEGIRKNVLAGGRAEALKAPQTPYTEEPAQQGV